jgi:hypothetical protein
MAVMSLYYENYLNTTTLCTVSAAASIDITTYKNLFDRKKSTQMVTSNVADNNTATTLHVQFGSSKNITGIMLQNINLKFLIIYYNSSSANRFTMNSVTEGTQTSQWSGNSATNLYIEFPTTTVDSVQVYMAQTTPLVEEKKVGELWIIENVLDFDRNPSAKQYKPVIKRKEYQHEMSDGGVATYIIADRYRADIKRTYVSETERDNLETLHQRWQPLTFFPDPTVNSWSGDVYSVNWVGDFNFYEYADNYRDNGFNGTIRLRERPK